MAREQSFLQMSSLNGGAAAPLLGGEKPAAVPEPTQAETERQLAEDQRLAASTNQETGLTNDQVEAQRYVLVCSENLWR